MTEPQWQAFCRFRDAFKAKCAEWNDAYAADLLPLQDAARDKPDYPLETAVVYNRALDDLTRESRITYLVIGDNPGKDEQRACNQRYLVGQSGRLAEGFFARNPALATDFRANVIILNKTPVHTAKTVHLRTVAKNGGERVRALLEESQLWMARETAALHRALYDGASAESGAAPQKPELWLVGYTELKKRGLFAPYRDALKAAYADASTDTGFCGAWSTVSVYCHFSMNQFSNDLRKELANAAANGIAEPLTATLARIGMRHKAAIFG